MIFLYILFAIIAILLTFVVLIQDEQGEGIGGLFGGGSSTAFGSRSGNVLTRFTGILAAVFFVVCLLLGLLNRSPQLGEVEVEKDLETSNLFFGPLESGATESGSVTDTGTTATTPAP